MFDFIQIFRSSIQYRRVQIGVALLVAVHIVGTVGYLIIGKEQHTTVIDALYMTFITVATIGYGEIVDLTHSPGGRVFTMLIAFMGIGTFTYLFSTATAFVLETNLNHAYRRRRMERKIAEMSGHYIVCGIGRVGSCVADELLKTEHPFVVIDPSEERLVAYAERTGHHCYMTGDASDDSMLLSAGVARCKGVFAVAGDDSKNLVISLSSRQLNPKARIVARVHDPRNTEKTRRAGADEIVSPDFIGGLRLASAMLRPHAVSFMDMMLRTNDGLRVGEVTVPAGFVPRSVASFAQSRDWILVAIRSGEQWHFNPAPETRVEPGHILIAILNPAGRRTLEAELGVDADVVSAYP
jgi:voltage-gated potassium channel